MDIIHEILLLATEKRPESPFLQSLYQQYCERGGLSKKQLEGLQHKVSRIPEMPPSWLVTLEAIIKKKPTRYKSEVSTVAPGILTNTKELEIITRLLSQYPAHKRLLFFKARLDNHEILSAPEIAEVEKFQKILDKKNEQ